MKYLEFDNAYGRIGNHFYWLLQAHKFSKQLNEPIKILKNSSYYDFNLEQSYKLFNLEQYAIDRNCLAVNDIVYKNITDPIKRYHQLFRIDFGIEDVEQFINDTFLKSQLYIDQLKNFKQNDNIIAIHIRNGDYVNNYGLDVFDRKLYILNALSILNSSIDTIIVYSDDNLLNLKLYDQIFKKRFKQVLYIIGTSGISDFVNFSLFKNKILWNSTFSYWAAFIGNVIHKHSYKNVIAPSRYGRTDPIADHINPLWTILEV